MMTGAEGLDEADIEDEIRRELEALKDWDLDNDATLVDEHVLLSSSSNEIADSPQPDSVETYIRLLQSRNEKLQTELSETRDTFYDSNVIEKGNKTLTDEENGEISEELREKVLTEITESERNITNDQPQSVPDSDETISSLEEIALNNLKELEKKQDERSDRLQSIFNEIKEDELSRRKREESKREENKRMADEEYKMKVEKNKNIKIKLDQEALSKQRNLEDMEKRLKLEMEKLAKEREAERIVLEKVKAEENDKYLLRQQVAAITIQKNYKRYRVMSKYGSALEIKREERQKRRKGELKALERREKELMEEAVRKAKEEEERRLKEIEDAKLEEGRRRIEEEKRRVEEERRRAEDEERKRRKEKEREEERLRQEEERRKEEERKRAEEEEKRVEEERKRVEEEERKRKDEERKIAEEHKRKQEEAERMKREEDERRRREHDERKRQEMVKFEEEKRRSEETRRKEEKDRRIEQERINEETRTPDGEAGEVNEELKKTTGHLLNMTSELENRRIAWLNSTSPWSSLPAEESKTTKSRARSRRPLSASQKLPSVSEEELKSSLKKYTSLDKVVCVNLKNLPARNLKLLLKCLHVKSITIHNCGLLSADSFDNCKYLKKIDLSDNSIQCISCQKHEVLEQLDLSDNQLTSIHGLDGCSNLYEVKLEGNKITRIGSGLPDKVMHLSLTKNQLISTRGLSQLKHLQILDCCHNHLNQVEEIESCVLLRVLKLCGNSLQKAPVLANHVLLRELHLSENSISTLETFSNQWLPLLQCLYLDNNSLSSVTPLRFLPMLQTLDLRNNLISDEENVLPGLIGCHQLRNLSICGNPVCEDWINIRSSILKTLPGLTVLDEENVGENLPNNDESLESGFFTEMCCSQILSQDDLLKRHEKKLIQNTEDENEIIKQLDLKSRCFKEMLQLSIQHRLEHEHFQNAVTAGQVVTGSSSTFVKPEQRKVVERARRLESVGDKVCQDKQHKAATKIQARFRGYRIRKRYLEATKSAQYPTDDVEDDDFNFDEEVDLTMFDESALDIGWMPTKPLTPSLPRDSSLPSESALPFQKPSPPKEHDRPFIPRQAWRSPDSPVLLYDPKRVIPPIDTKSAASEQTSPGESTERSHRTSELSTEWGFHQNSTAELMLKRAKRMKHNAQRKKKMNDPGRRFELFKKTDEANKARDVQTVKKKKEKPRIDYFTGRPTHSQQSSARNTPQQDEEESAKQEMTFSWVYDQAVLHKDKGDDIIQDAQAYLTESKTNRNQRPRSPPFNLPKMDPVILAGRNLPLVASPVGNPRPSQAPSSGYSLRTDSKYSWTQEKTHSNPDLTRAGVTQVSENREKSNSADARMMRERNN